MGTKITSSKTNIQGMISAVIETVFAGRFKSENKIVKKHSNKNSLYKSKEYNQNPASIMKTLAMENNIVNNIELILSNLAHALEYIKNTLDIRMNIIL
ncbi:hypothetical protein JCM15831A_27640 [Asaia astilbis]